MKKFVKTYKNKNEKDINYGLINREYEMDLVDYIVDCCKSLEALPNIKFIDYDYVTDESKIDVSQYINEKSREKTTDKKTKDKRKITRYRYMDDSRYGELRLKFSLSCNGENEELTKKILIPVKDDNNYYLIKGTKYILMYQIVDNSTYTTKDSLPLKSMMPVSLKMDTVNYTDTDGLEHEAPIYTILLFKKKMNILLFYLATMGLDMTLRYFSAYDIIRFTDKDMHNDETISFPINSKMYLEVSKKFFNKYQYTRVIVFMLLDAMASRISMDDLNDYTYWIEAIGSIGTANKNNRFEKGVNTITFFNRLLDDTTKRLLKLHPVHKQNIYSILRWMIMHFDDLRKKDNMDLKNRRLRCNEYIAALLTRVFGERVNRIISLGSKATLKNIKEIFKFPGDILTSQLHKSGLLRFDDRINDMDFFAKLKVTMKGPNSLGGTNDNNISAKYRGIDPSYIGRIDLNVCGTSDPGTSAALTPFCKTDGMFFDSSHEPEQFKYEFDKDIHDTYEKDSYVKTSFKTMEEYFNYNLGIDEVLDKLIITETDNSVESYYVPLFSVIIGDEDSSENDSDEDFSEEPDINELDDINNGIDDD